VLALGGSATVPGAVWPWLEKMDFLGAAPNSQIFPSLSFSKKAAKMEFDARPYVLLLLLLPLCDHTNKQHAQGSLDELQLAKENGTFCLHPNVPGLAAGFEVIAAAALSSSLPSSRKRKSCV
jgi:hypothetical protein